MSIPSALSSPGPPILGLPFFFGLPLLIGDSVLGRRSCLLLRFADELPAWSNLLLRIRTFSYAPESHTSRQRRLQSQKESNIPLKQLPPVAKTLTMQVQKRKNTIASSYSDSDSSEYRPSTQRRKKTHSKSRSTTADKQYSSAAPAPNTSSAEQPPFRPLPPPPRPSTSSSIPPPNDQPSCQGYGTSLEGSSIWEQAGNEATYGIAAGLGLCAAPKPKALQTISIQVRSLRS
ncbi:hypothetical protein C8R48DRAFT_769861 [Suillus tomentosus]|nr:hypothetical protein C8R48DRAFT_769861 [Suillus tomentosus]